MAAAQHTFECPQGESFHKTIYWEAGDPLVAVDTTGYSGRMQLRTGPNGPVLVELNSDGAHDGLISFGGVDGSIILDLDAATTAPLTPGLYSYDLFLTAPAGGATKRKLAGGFQITAAVTHD